MRRHLILDAPHAVIVLAHRLSLGFCMDLLHSRPTMWGRVVVLFFLYCFLIKRTFEPVVMIFGCNSTCYLSYNPPQPIHLQMLWGGGFLVPTGIWP